MKKMFVVLEVLKEHGPLSSVDLGALMGITGASTRDHLYNLRDMHEVHVHSWRPALGYKMGRSCQLWAAGDAKDAPKPLLRSHHAKKSLHVLKDEDDGYEVHLHNELRKRAKEIKPFRHWQDVAFFGEVRP